MATKRFKRRMLQQKLRKKRQMGVRRSFGPGKKIQEFEKAIEGSKKRKSFLKKMEGKQKQSPTPVIPEIIVEKMIAFDSLLYANTSFAIVTQNLPQELNKYIMTRIIPWKEGSRTHPIPNQTRELVGLLQYTPNIMVRLSHPNSFHCMKAYPNSYKIGYGVTEGTKIERIWVRECNEIDEVWVPSTFVKKSFEDSGVTKPITVIPHGIDPKIFNPNGEKYNLNLPENSFIFMTIGVAQERKGTRLLIEAFNEEFTEKNIFLVVKSNSQGKLDDLPKYDNVIYKYEEIPYNKIGDMFRACDVFVLPTKGEGFGMPILEAMACKKPVIVTNISGHLDFVSNNEGWLINVEEMTPAFHHKNDKFGLWAEPSKEHLKKCMREAFKNDKLRKEKGENAFKRAMNYTWEKVAEMAMERLFQVDPSLGDSYLDFEEVG